eukprot:CAMPEP_0117651212 /NCGR_PEP_ID=MMETSP0804-20121206/1969_1 /TAXON_ID=1074897 /ORGANISM="Tetraselmis astigmatica, Strain CCMP880" /LENGTH=165 /DNA_ID=CAMNT_0005457169 /DNA_START=18 /DNA_END=512 /DNA_ORIENTATION=+
MRRDATTPVAEVNPSAARFPFCVVWSPIPIITWLVPFVGHMGVCASEGVILDFAGPYFVSRDSFAFGRATRYLYLPPERAEELMDIVGVSNGGPTLPELWDGKLSEATQAYSSMMYNFCANNCHEFVAHFLNTIGYAGSRRWNMVTLAAMMTVKGRFVSLPALLW